MMRAHDARAMVQRGPEKASTTVPTEGEGGSAGRGWFKELSLVSRKVGSKCDGQGQKRQHGTREKIRRFSVVGDKRGNLSGGWFRWNMKRRGCLFSSRGCTIVDRQTFERMFYAFVSIEHSFSVSSSD